MDLDSSRHYIDKVKKKEYLKKEIDMEQDLDDEIHELELQMMQKRMKILQLKQKRKLTEQDPRGSYYQEMFNISNSSERHCSLGDSTPPLKYQNYKEDFKSSSGCNEKSSNYLNRIIQMTPVFPMVDNLPLLGLLKDMHVTCICNNPWRMAELFLGILVELLFANKFVFSLISDNTERHRNPRQLSFQELGIAKLSGFREWLSIHPIIAEREHPGSMNMNLKTHKMLVFAHHLKVLDGVQEFLCEKEIGFVRIDGNTLARDRQSAVQTFRSSPEIKIAIIGITAGGVGIDFSSAQNVVFLEMPQSTSEMQQDTTDESRWHNLNKSLHRVSSMMNGKYDAIQEITVERVSDLCFEGYVSECQVSEENDTKDPKSKASSANPVNVTDSTGNESALAGIASCNELSEIEISNAKSSDVNIGMETVEEVPDTDGSDEHAQADSISLSQADYLHLGDSVPRYASVILRIGTPDRIITTKLNEASYKIAGSVHTSKVTLFLSGETTLLNLSMLQASKTVSAASKGDESVPVDLIVSDSDSLISADSLRFEVSQYTGRVHLYTCIPGKDTRPKPLFENFRPEELQLTHVSDENTNKQTDRKCIKKSPAYKHILLEFVKQWNNLRPIEQKKLFGKPLQLPLGLELCYLQESINHGAGGLLKGGSKRRATPLHEIIYALPENAEWKTISLSTGNQKKGRQYTQAWSMSGEPLCKLCQKQCEGKLAKIPQFFEDLFCNLACFEEYRTRTSGRWLREELFKIEHGVCTMCNLDCHKLVCSIKPLSAAKRREYIERVAPNVASRKKLLSRLVSEAIEGNAWHADHIVPVSEGGGECNLDNIRTLCVACHYKVTAALCNDTRVRRNKAKKQLKAIMRGLKDDFYTKQSTSDLKEGENLKIGENPIEDELVIRVPGSAYTASSSKVPAESEEQYAS
ncbi:hypothetical protein GIB67_007248 [Kingdonia uniflora]|uniref:Helicase C-terminal domain-containing protein n=1 Tax=Kingdonia uniflora TaxID=39325 RepID=A0A7J7NWZ4_9MAGN|nr:hypothetical protein GIB67_007248 [Kingdonia uniflora]